MSTAQGGGSGSSSSADDPSLLALVDNNASTCVTLQPQGSQPYGASAAWAVVDLGYVATVTSLAIAAGGGIPVGLPAELYVQQGPLDPPSQATSCNPQHPLQLEVGGWASQACNLTGRCAACRPMLC